MESLFKKGPEINKEIDDICSGIIDVVKNKLKKEGAVVGISGGVDSAVVAYLLVKALGKDNVFGVILPEKDSNESSKRLGIEVAERLGIRYEVFDITHQLDSFKIYDKINEILRNIYLEFDETHKYKIIIPNNLLSNRKLSLYYIVIEDKDGKEVCRKRLNYYDYKAIQAALSFKLRVRMSDLYYYAEKNNYLVAGTTNRTEYDLGNFCKYGDGGVDFEVISHLYKTEVYNCAKALEISQEIIDRPPSPDTCSSFVTDEEFYFSLDIPTLDKILCGYNNNINSSVIAKSLSIEEEQVNSVLIDIKNKQNNTAYLKKMPIMCKS